MNKISVYVGTGFIGGAFCDLYSDNVIKIAREEREPLSKDIIYFIIKFILYIEIIIIIN